MLVKNEIEIKNFDEIPAMLEAAQKKCRERLVSGKAWWISLPLPYEPHDSGGAWLTPAESLKAMYARRAMNY